MPPSTEALAKLLHLGVPKASRHGFRGDFDGFEKWTGDFFLFGVVTAKAFVQCLLLPVLWTSDIYFGKDTTLTSINPSPTAQRFFRGQPKPDIVDSPPWVYPPYK